ncbi:MAG TPA: putative sugar nucleotidyl transferase [Gemmataceae bacterium]|nr:putative sugar nucleotidyl transferase [Gemmataceae bacterium]
MRICIFEDAGCMNLEPLALTRPAFDLRCGALTLLERQLRQVGAVEVAAFVRPFLADFCRFLHPEMRVNDATGLDHGPVVLVNARWLPDLGESIPMDSPAVGMIDDEITCVVLPDGAVELSPESLLWRLEECKQTLPHRETGGALMAYPWDLVEHNAEALRQDFVHRSIVPEAASLPAGVSLVGAADSVRIDPSAHIEPMVLIDASKGPVLIDRGAVVQAFSRLEGPCYVGPDSHILGAKLRGGSIGPNCRIGGEVEVSVVYGHANKAHDGFLGHSYVGEWVNLGAGTQVSDLRTDYGAVSFRIAGRTIDSGLMKVGAFLGDHAKTSINAQLNTGTIVGPFGQLLTNGGLMPRLVPAFCRVGHGRLQERTDLRELFETASVVMGRRKQRWAEAHAEFFLALYEQTEEERRQMIREAEQRRLRRVV